MHLLPSLALAPQPRIICTTSCFHYLGTYDVANWNGESLTSPTSDPGTEGVTYYKNNKLYFQIWVAELQHRLLQHQQYKHITINGFHPGYVNSGIWMTHRSGWIMWLLSYVLVFAAWMFGIDERQGSWGLVYVATSPECGPDARVQGDGKGRDLRGEKMDERGGGGGRYFNRIWEDEGMPHCRDRDARLRVWRRGAEETGMREKGLLDVLGLYSGEGKGEGEKK